MKREQLQQVLDEGVIGQVAADYLTIYVGHANWDVHIAELQKRLIKRFNNDLTKVAEVMRQAICCAVLLPAMDKSTIIDPANPENLLYRCMSFRQFEERDWFKVFKDVVKKDLDIWDWRREALSFGVVDPIDYHPNYRQAYNWLYQRAEESGAVTEANKADMVDKFQKLVKIYGGAVICNIFTRNTDHLKRIINWRSGYFFERLIFDIYTPEQVFRIKKAELSRANKELVYKVRV